MVTSVKTPCNAVELEVDSFDLVLSVEGDEVETLDLVLLAANTGEVPVP